MTSELAVGEFLDCLVEVEKSFYSLQIATRKIFKCIDKHLDVRGFWNEVINEIKPRDAAPFIDPYMPPTPSGIDQCISECFQPYENLESPLPPELSQCLEACTQLYSDVISPIMPIDSLPPKIEN